MIVENNGYLKLDAVKAIPHFSIYLTNKGTNILVIGTSDNQISLYQPKKDRLPWKLTEGKKICYGKKIFDSKTDNELNLSSWNNGNQIMSYKEYSLW